MIGSLLYLTSSRQELNLSVGMCVIYQAKTKDIPEEIGAFHNVFYMSVLRKLVTRPELETSVTSVLKLQRYPGIQ